MRNLSVLAVMLVAKSAIAGDLGIIGDNLTWASPTDPSPQFLFRIYNETGTADELFGWQLSIEVIPSVTATGTVQIHSAVAPDDYILAAGSTGIWPPSFPPATRVDWINDLSLFGAGVPPAPGANLLKIDFLAFPDAAGRFDVAVIPGEFSSNWLSAGFFPTRDFVNVPFDGQDPVTVGSVTIGGTAVIPEPSSLAVIGGLFGVAFGLRTLARRRDCQRRGDA